MPFRHAALVAAALLAIAPFGPVVAQSDFEAFPLRPPDTSSPRATLREFIANVNAAWQAVEREDYAESHRIRQRLEELLDYSETVDGNEYEERTRRIAYLKEILDRIALPPDEAIPGADEVAAGDITHWTIPDTTIRIARIEEGDRAGEYVFSAGSVGRLRRYYHEARHLPYKPGASIGLLEFLLEADAVITTTAEEGVRERLKPPRAASPRAMLQHFLLNVNAAHALMREAEAGFRASPPTMTREEARVMEREAEIFLGRAIALVDLSETPEALRDNVGIETALLLKEIIDRTMLPRIESIPSVRQVALQKQANDGAPVTWVYPDTSIEIAEIAEGPLKGEFRFSARTVGDAEGLYEAVHDLPYRDEIGVDRPDQLTDYDSPELSKGIYDYYISTPGTLIPAASRLGTLLTNLPPWLTAIRAGQTVWQWIGVVLSACFALLVFFLVYRTGDLVTRNAGPAKSSWVLILVPLVNALVVVRTVHFVDKELNTTGFVVSAALAVGTVLLFVFFASAAYRLAVAVGETIVASRRIVEGGFDASLVRIGTRAVGFIAGVTLVVQGVQRAGADVVPLLAGLGVGGLAVALAVRPTLENMIGGLILYADRPIRLGDFCTFGALSGTVERIGLRSTRVRALDRTLVTIPNATFADMQLVNYAHCDKMLIETVIGLRYETTPEQLRHVLAKLRQICLAHPKIETDTLRVRFGAFGASSLDVNVRVYALTNEWNEYHAVREDLYLRFAEAIEASGTGVAFPSSTVYLSRDGGLDPDRTRMAEKEVAAWREAEELPFPRMPEQFAARITDTGDYPPVGSPEATGKAVAVPTGETLAGPEIGELMEAEIEARSEEGEETPPRPR